MILLIDNYDSFSYNLYQLIGEMEQDIRVIRNDEMTVEEIKSVESQTYHSLARTGKTRRCRCYYRGGKDTWKKDSNTWCLLGHQAICAAFGATVTYAKELMHGKQSPDYI